MEAYSDQSSDSTPRLEKSKTGIKGLDEVLFGGLPTGRPTLLCGGAGCGKTLLATEFLVRGATEFNEPGVYMAFEETAEELTKNVASLGIDLSELIQQKKLTIDYVHIDRSEIEETGEYDLEGLFIRLASAIEMVGAKRVVLDTIEAVFSAFSNEAILRSELRRLFRWLKDRGVTAIITAERGQGALTRHGLEEYVSDCVILLDNRVRDGAATRLLRVVKYRGSSHGTDEYPFLIDKEGIWVLPITSVGLDYPVSREIISTGILSLDRMFQGQGFYRGSSILVSGTAGTGKTSLAASIVNTACQLGERCIYFAYEESADQIIRNMRSIGIDLGQWVEQDLLRFYAVRPSLYGAEMHLLKSQKLTQEFSPHLVVMDPMNSLTQVASVTDVKSLMVRLIDFFKMNHITAIFTSLTGGEMALETTDIAVSSLMDVWILLVNLENNGERNRGLYILKARGSAHSNQVREFLITDQGIDLIQPYFGQGQVMTGTARRNQEAAERADAELRRNELERKKRELERKRKVLNAQIEALQAEFNSEEEELLISITDDENLENAIKQQGDQVRRSRLFSHFGLENNAPLTDRKELPDE